VGVVASIPGTLVPRPPPAPIRRPVAQSSTQALNPRASGPPKLSPSPCQVSRPSAGQPPVSQAHLGEASALLRPRRQGSTGVPATGSTRGVARTVDTRTRVLRSSPGRRVVSVPLGKPVADLAQSRPPEHGPIESVPRAVTGEPAANRSRTPAPPLLGRSTFPFVPCRRAPCAHSPAQSPRLASRRHRPRRLLLVGLRTPHCPPCHDSLVDPPVCANQTYHSAPHSRPGIPPECPLSALLNQRPGPASPSGLARGGRVAARPMPSGPELPLLRT